MLAHRSPILPIPPPHPLELKKELPNNTMTSLEADLVKTHETENSLGRL